MASRWAPDAALRDALAILLRKNLKGVRRVEAASARRGQGKGTLCRLVSNSGIPLFAQMKMVSTTHGRPRVWCDPRTTIIEFSCSDFVWKLVRVFRLRMLRRACGQILDAGHRQSNPAGCDAVEKLKLVGPWVKPQLHDI